MSCSQHTEASETFLPCSFTGSDNLAGTDSCLIFSWLGADRRGPRSASPPSSLPSRNQRSRRRLLPPLLQQPTSNRPLGATAQAPASGANNALLRAQVDGVTTARPGSGAVLGSCQKGFLPPFLSALSTPLKGPLQIRVPPCSAEGFTAWAAQHGEA